MTTLGRYAHIAVLQTAFIGDVALVLYLMQAVRNMRPDVQLTLVTTPAGASLARCATAVNTVLPFDKRGEYRGWKGIREMAATLRKSTVDCILAPHRSLRTTAVAHLARPDFSVGFNRNAWSFLYSRRVFYPYHLHEAERNLRLLSVFGDVPTDIFHHAPSPDIVVASAHGETVREQLRAAGVEPDKPLVVLAPGSVWPTKRWPHEYFHAVARTLCAEGCNVVLSGSPADAALCRQVADGTPAISLAGKTSLPETLALLQQADVLVSNDSAPTHLANLVHCPVLTIFGPTTPMFGFAPRYAEDRILEQKELACRPCSIHGQQACPLGHFACMKNTVPDAVVGEVRDILQHVYDKHE